MWGETVLLIYLEIVSLDVNEVLKEPIVYSNYVCTLFLNKYCWMILEVALLIVEFF